jgi:isopenicillin-N epimerase
LKPGDEILSTNLEYGALVRTWNYYCDQKGAKFIQQPIPLPITSEEEIIEAFFKGYSENTKAIFISQLTSSTALILPVEEICKEAKKRGLITIVDGAHVPGHIPLDLKTLSADIYTGACHKWMMAPKGSSFLYVTEAIQRWFDPLLISWGFNSDFPSESQFIDYHQTCGTRDFSAFLTVPFCIEFMHRNNWNEISSKNKSLTLDWALNLKDTFPFEPISPINSCFLGQMFAIPIKTTDPVKLKQHLYHTFKIEIPVTQMQNRFFIRYSVQEFNDESDFCVLKDALVQLQKSGIIKF